VPIGSFVAQAFGASGFASGIVTVSPRETARVELAVTPPAVVRGRLVFDGANDPSLSLKARISLTGGDFIRGPAGRVQPKTVINEDGTFEVSGLFTGDRLSFDVPLPWTLTSVTSGGADITDQPIDSSAGDVNDVRVLFIPKASTVVGIVTDTNGRRVMNGFVLVFPLDSSRWAYPSRWVRGLAANANGDFGVSGLPPGVYRAIAFERVPRPDWMNPDYLDTLQGLGETFTVWLGESTTIRLQLRTPLSFTRSLVPQFPLIPSSAPWTGSSSPLARRG
jgi:hypothetical protein